MRSDQAWIVEALTVRRRQRPIRGGRLHGSTGFEPRVWKALQREASKFGVSIPFVLSVMAADCLGIELDDKDRYRRPRLQPTIKLAKRA
jgi:hypothetical protein